MSDFVEAKTLHFTMVEEKPAVLKCFERFLYTGELFDEDQNNGTTSQAESDVANYGSEHGCDENSRQTKQTFLVELWVFGDRRGVPALQDQAITALYREMCRQQEVSTHAIMTAYENTLRGTALRAFFTEHFVHLTNFSFARNTNLFHQEFLADICDKATLLLHQKTTSKAAVQHKIDVSDFFVSDCGGRITFPGMYAARRSDDHDRQPSSRAPSPDTKRAHASTGKANDLDEASYVSIC